MHCQSIGSGLGMCRYSKSNDSDSRANVIRTSLLIYVPVTGWTVTGEQMMQILHPLNKLLHFVSRHSVHKQRRQRQQSYSFECVLLIDTNLLQALMQLQSGSGSNGLHVTGLRNYVTVSMAKAKSQTWGFKTAVQKPMSDITKAPSIFYTVYGFDSKKFWT